MIQKEWVLAPPAPVGLLQDFLEINPILAQVLYNRGFDDAEDARRFLYATGLDEDPFDMTGIAAAVERITAAVAAEEEIVVYGDFDADGVTATALMVQVLTALGANVSPYIPDRVEEGYGLNALALENLADSGARLIVTVDCGIRSIAEVEAGNRAGLDTIVTDHHSIGPEIPAAFAVVNPQLEPEKGRAHLAGVGVAFMLAKALLMHRWREDRSAYPPELRLSDLLDLVALGTVADIVPLNAGLNRRLVRHGLETINEMRRPGIQALAQVAGLRTRKVSAADIGFILGPRINAAGRLGSAMTAYELLMADNLECALPYAQELQSLNLQRQYLTNQAEAAVSEQVDEYADKYLIFAADENFRPGIVGLVAGRLTEQFYRPAIVLEIGAEESRASCRSIPEFDITRALDESADLLIRHGGHAMAAGFTVHNSNLPQLRRSLEDKAERLLATKTLVRKLQVDMEIELRELEQDLVEDLNWLEPTGHQNPPPTFASRDMQVLSIRSIGDEGKHLKLKIARNGQPPLDAIGFGLGDRAKSLPRKIDAAYHIELNEWNGRRNLQMRLLDIRPSETHP